VILHALATWRDTLAIARNRGHLSADGLAQVRAFLENPETWSAARGGKSSAEIAAGTI
jgi:orotate phosphoribosyltransferase